MNRRKNHYLLTLKYGEQADKTILWALQVWPSQAKVTSVNDFSSLRCLNEDTIFVWKSFQRRQNCCWSPCAILIWYLFLFDFKSGKNQNNEINVRISTKIFCILNPSFTNLSHFTKRTPFTYKICPDVTLSWVKVH